MKQYPVVCIQSQVGGEQPGKFEKSMNKRGYMWINLSESE